MLDSKKSLQQQTKEKRGWGFQEDLELNFWQLRL